MIGCQNFIDQIIASLPEVCRTSDLVTAKVFKSRDAAWRARIHHEGPAYIQLNARNVIYTKESVREWLNNHHQIPEQENG